MGHAPGSRAPPPWGKDHASQHTVSFQYVSTNHCSSGWSWERQCQTSPGGWLEGQRLRPPGPRMRALNVQFSGGHVLAHAVGGALCQGALTLQLGLYSRGYQLHKRKTHKTLCLHEHEGGGRRQGMAQLPGKRGRRKPGVSPGAAVSTDSCRDAGGHPSDGASVLQREQQVEGGLSSAS